jgi:hypothetical protein
MRREIEQGLKILQIYKFFQHVVAKRYKKTKITTSWEKKNPPPQKTL